MGNGTRPALTGQQLYGMVAQHYGVEPGALSGPRFGSNALKVNGKIFATLSNGRLLIKLPAGRVEALVQEKLGERFSTGPGRIKKEWVTVAPSSADEWIGLSEESRDYVLSQVR
jgi:hypothetical protein